VIFHGQAEQIRIGNLLMSTDHGEPEQSIVRQRDGVFPEMVLRGAACGVQAPAHFGGSRFHGGIRRVAQDPDAAELMGVRINRVLALCFGFGAMMAALGGLLLSMTSIMLSPVRGMQYTLIAIIVVVLGGLGNIKGSFIGGFILGLVGYIVSSSQPGLSMVAYYVIFLFLLLVRPTGLLGK
jgi:branched-chain amino acid transport system permease protein